MFVDGAFCGACALFAPSQAGGRNLGHFVVTPFKTWTKMTEIANKHANKEYHLIAMAKMEEFLGRCENPSQRVLTDI